MVLNQRNGCKERLVRERQSLCLLIVSNQRYLGRDELGSAARDGQQEIQCGVVLCVSRSARNGRIEPPLLSVLLGGADAAFSAAHGDAQ